MYSIMRVLILEAGIASPRVTDPQREAQSKSI
jgi:hypothetical protein